MRTQIKLAVALCMALALVSCKKNDGVPTSNLTVKATLAENTSVSLADFSVEATNTSTGKSYSGATGANGQATLTVEEGIYTVKVEATKEIPYLGKSTVRGLVENLTVQGDAAIVEVNLTISKPSSGWVFKELYFTGSKTPNNKKYYKDKYFELYNNSDQILYADGISLCESEHVTAFATNNFASYLDRGVVVQTIYTIPGNGAEHPVEPGKSIILCDVAIDHTAENPNSFNLSTANFEWYDDHALDVDVPNVPNLVKYYSYSLSIWTPHDRGFRSYLIFRPEGGSMEEFMAANTITYTRPNGSEGKAYLVPNSVILDAVELSTPSDFKSKALGVSLDAGWTHCGDSDDARYGKCVRRKVERRDGSRVIYKDTNNSTEDFESTVTPKPGIIE